MWVETHMHALLGEISSGLHRCCGLSSAAAFAADSGTWTSCSRLKTESSEWPLIRRQPRRWKEARRVSSQISDFISCDCEFSLCHIYNPILLSQACSYRFCVSFALSSFLFLTWLVLPLCLSRCFSISTPLRMSFDPQCFHCDIMKSGTASSRASFGLGHIVFLPLVCISCLLHPSNTTCNQGIGNAGASPSCVEVKAGLQPRQVSSLSSEHVEQSAIISA